MNNFLGKGHKNLVKRTSQQRAEHQYRHEAEDERGKDSLTKENPNTSRVNSQSGGTRRYGSFL